MPERDAQAMARPAAVGPWIRRPIFGASVGAAVGAVLTAVILMMSSSSAGYQWPPQKSILFLGGSFTPRTMAGGGVAALPSDCNLMLIGVNSTVPLEVWLAPHGADINFTSGTSSPRYYYWSGTTPLEQLRTVVSLTNPAQGFSFTLFDPSNSESGNATWGYAFSSSDCG